MAGYPSIKARELLRILQKAPLNYVIERQKGSHRKLTAPGRPPLIIAFHDNLTIPPGLVRKILVDQVGLSDDEARGLV